MVFVVQDLRIQEEMASLIPVAVLAQGLWGHVNERNLT